MSAVQALIVVGGFLVLLTATVTVMNRVVRSEREVMERRRQEWIAGGRNPDEEPNFFAGSGCGGG